MHQEKKMLAHISEDGTRVQTVADHLQGTAVLCGQFAAAFDAQQQGTWLGLLHDIGKYSTKFQKRLQGGEKVDHSTAGAQVAARYGQIPLAFAIAGHHSGLPDGGGRSDTAQDATMFGRLKKSVEPYTHGAVMTTFVKGALNCGQVRGPVQLSFARSVDPVLPQEVTITRIAITTEADAERKGTEMGRKYVIPYGLYRAEGYVSANLARKTTGFSEDDLQLLWQAILNMFENDHSAARGKMAVRELIVFKHDSELGNAPSYKLFDAVHVTRAEGVAFPRSYHDYVVTVDENLPAGVTCERLS